MAPSWLVVTAVPQLGESGDDRLRGTSHPALPCPALPVSHHLLPQIQPDGVTLKYNEYAWNKVQAQALLLFLTARWGGPEPVPPALSTELTLLLLPSHPTHPPLESAVEQRRNVATPAQPWGGPGSCGCCLGRGQQPLASLSQTRVSPDCWFLCCLRRLPTSSTWSLPLVSASHTPMTRSMAQMTRRRVTGVQGEPCCPACPLLGMGCSLTT